MTPVGEILWRNRQQLAGDSPTLLLNPPSDALAAQLQAESLALEAVCLSHRVYQALAAQGVAAGFGITPAGADRWRQVILFQPREKALLEMMLDLCAALLREDGVLWVVGENRAGIKSAKSRIEARFGACAKLDSARHCTLFSAKPAAANNAGRRFSLDEYVAEWPLETAHGALAVHSLPGVFAHGRLDRGTRLLIDALGGEGAGQKVTGRVLDFACGAGVIGLALAASAGAMDLTMLDDSVLALESARRTLQANGVEADLVASDGYSELLASDPVPAYDWIISNPPFHRGIHQELEVTRNFLEQSRELLAPGGRLCLVANVHLPYQRWLSELFAEVQVIAADREYNTWLACGPRR